MVYGVAVAVFAIISQADGSLYVGALFILIEGVVIWALTPIWTDLKLAAQKTSSQEIAVKSQRRREARAVQAQMKREAKAAQEIAEVEKNIGQREGNRWLRHTTWGLSANKP